MCRQRDRIAVVLLLWLLCAGPRLSAGPAPIPPSLPAVTPSPAFFRVPEVDPRLAVDARLDRKVSLDEVGTPLDAVLKKMGGDLTPLDCGASCADRKVQVRVTNRPLRAVMAALAQLEPGTWKTDGTGYRLEVAAKATDYEDHWWDLYAQERERALNALRAAILAQMRQKPIFSPPGYVDPENTPPAMSAMMSQSQEFWYLLPPSLQEQVAGQIVETAYYRAGPIFTNRTIEGAVVAPFASLPPQAQADILADAAPLNGRGIHDPINVSFNNVGFVVRPRIATADGQWHDVMFPLGVHSEEVPPTLSLNHTGLPALVKKLGDKAPETWKPLAAYQEQRVWPNDPPRQKPNPAASCPRQAEVLNWLADKAGVEFVADYYSSGGDSLTLVQKGEKLSRPLKDEMDFRAAQEDMSWKTRGDGLTLFRDNRWYRDDRLEVPDKIIQSLLQSLHAADKAAGFASPEANFAAQLDLAGEIVAQLTPYQIANGLPNYVPESGTRAPAPAAPTPAPVRSKGSITFDAAHLAGTGPPFGQIAETVLDDYNTYLFYGALDPAQSDALLAGSLPASALTAPQAQQAAYLLPDIQVARQNQPTQPLLLGLRPDSGLAPAQSGYSRVRLMLSTPPQP